MKTKALFTAAVFTAGLIGLAWAQPGPLAGPAPRDGGPNQPPPPAAPGRPGAPSMGAGPAPLLRLLDADHDGQLSAAEFANAGTALAALDKNKDGNVTQDELWEHARQRPQPGEHILRLDADKDGSVSFDEFTAELKKPFETIDTNHDGKISKDEAAVAPPPPPVRQGPPGAPGRMSRRGPGGRGGPGFDDDGCQGPPRGPRGQGLGPRGDFGSDEDRNVGRFHGNVPPRGARHPDRPMDRR